MKWSFNAHYRHINLPTKYSHNENIYYILFRIHLQYVLGFFSAAKNHITIYIIFNADTSSVYGLLSIIIFQNLQGSGKDLK